MKRTHFTVAQIKNLQLHAIRIQGQLHVTGLTLYGALIVPTRSFWSQLALLANLSEPEFGKEYGFFHRCLRRIGERSLRFTLTVHGDKATLLTGVRAFTDTDMELSCSWHATGDRGDIELKNSWNIAIEDRHRSIFEDRDVRIEANEFATADTADSTEESWNHDWAESAAETGMEWPLLSAAPSEAKHQRLWGWDDLPLPSCNAETFLAGPLGNSRPSRN